MGRREIGDTDKLPTDTLVDGEIELRLPADAAHLFLLRLLAEGIATRANFDLDTIADTKMAVDEVAASLVERAAPGANLHCRFRSFGGDLTVWISAPTRSGEVPSTQTFEWHVLTTLTDSISARADAGGVVHIEFTKRPGAVPK